MPLYIFGPPYRWTPFLAFFLLMGPSLTAAQPKATVRVVATSSEDGRTLPGANVVLTSLVGENRYAGATDVDGYHQISGIVPGRYALAVSFVGFKTYRDTLALTAEERRTVSTALEVQEQALDEVRVEAERGAAQRQAGLQTVGAADLERIPTPGPSGDLASYLQTLPGIVSAGDRGGQLYVRGGTPSQNLILVDGVRIIKPFHISSLYSAFPQEIVRSADVYAGGFSAEYMGATSSVIDVSLRRGNMKRFVGSASVSPFIVSSRLEGPLVKGQQSFLVVARHSVIEETAESLIGQQVPLRFYDLTGRYSIQSEVASCSITAIRTDDEGRINTGRNTVLSWSNTTLGGRCLMFGESLDHALDISAGYTRFDNAAGTRDDPERTAGLSKVYLGLEREQQLLGQDLKFGFRWSVTQYEANLDEKFITLRRLKQNGAALQAYVAMDITPSDRLTITPSLGTHVTSTRLEQPTYEPRLRVSYRPDGTARQEFSLALGKYNQVAEGITDERDAGTVFTIWRLADEADAPPQALHGILGYRQRLGDRVEASVEGYLKDLSNILVPEWTPEARFNTRTTLADGLAYGVDARLEIEAGGFYTYFGYGWTNVTYEAARDDLGAWIQGNLFEYTPAHDRRHQVNAVASYDLAGFTTNLSWEFGSGRPYTKVYGFDLLLELPDQRPMTNSGTARTLFDQPYGARLPTYHRLDVSVARSVDVAPRLSLELKAGAINTYDRANIFYYDVNTLGRVDQTPFLPYASLRVLVE